MYTVALAIKVHRRFKRKLQLFSLTVTQGRGHQGEALASTQTDGDGSIRFKKEINSIFFKAHQTFGSCADGVWNPWVPTLRRASAPSLISRKS